MNWLIFALVPPLLYSINNHVDKYLVERFFKNRTSEKGGIGSLVIFTGLISILFCLIIGIAIPSQISISFPHALVIILSGILLVGSYVPYFSALEYEEASVITPLWQFIPIFGYILGFFFLGETLRNIQIIGGFLIILGAISISISFDKKSARIKKGILLKMMGAAFLVSLSILLFKIIALQENFWASVFWEYAGIVVFSLFLFICIKSYRQQFLSLMRQNTAGFVLVNVLGEVLSFIAKLASNYVSLLVPIALLLLVNSLQPFFVFIIGIVLTVFLPQLGREKLSGRDILQKFFAIGVMIAGTLLLIFF
ncbi:MAG: EamA family transporter [Candidatus Pacebacteria bacterium]|nr:EamA family transporter [Candidatus Paceibacterota bacterium]